MIGIGCIIAGRSFCAGAPAAELGQYLWPTDASRAVTSSFGEYRQGHFHAGIDIKTWGRVGYRVFAVRPGYIWKVRVSPFGYGKVIYQILDTGEIAVYAHLSDFMPSLKRRVKSAQRRRLRYSVTLEFSPNEIPARKGQVIGYTGDTGVGYPHLHFEIRDRQNRPLNPFLRGFAVRDEEAPALKAFAVVPLAWWSRVNGDVAMAIETPVYVSGNRYRIEQPVRVWGPVAFSLAASDGTSSVRNRICIYSIRLYVDGRLIYTCRYDRFSYGETSLVKLDRDYRLRVRTQEVYHRLFVHPGNELSFYDDFGTGAGVIWAGGQVREGILNSKRESWLNRLKRATSLRAGEHELRLVVSDFNGNETTLTATLLVQRPEDEVALTTGKAEAAQAEGGEDSSEHLDVDLYEDYARIQVSDLHPVAEMPRLSVEYNRKTVPLRAWLLDPSTVVAVWQLPEERHITGTVVATIGARRLESPFELWAIDGEPVRVRVPASTAEVRFPAGAGYRPFYATAVVDSLAASALSPEPVMPPIFIGPEDVPLRKSVRLIQRFNQSPLPLEKLGWYYCGPDKWAFIGNTIDREKMELMADITGLGAFAVVADTTAPELWFLSPTDGAVVSTPRPRVQIHIDDALSGISAEDDFEVRLDGRKVVVEWDPEEKTLSYLPDEDLASGGHVMMASARDRCGNESRAEVQFRVEVRKGH